MKNRYILKLKDAELDLSARTHIMGILNVTPDSFSDGGRFFGKGGAPGVEEAVEAALVMAGQGADIIDVGGESTRPSSVRVPPELELSRVIPVIEGIRKRSGVAISIDTYKAETARAAVAAGASIINDISGLGFDPGMPKAAAETGAALIIMHIKGTPANMQDDPRYGDVVAEVREFFIERTAAAIGAGVAPEKVLLDVGIGFGKSLAHNLTLINRMDEFASLGRPMVLGVSRKAFIGSLTAGAPAQDRVEGTLAACALGIARGAHIIRVHDVAKAARAAAVADAILGAV